MKVGLLGLLILTALIGCGAPAPSPTLAPPTLAPIALAQTTNAPTTTRDPNATTAPQPTRGLTAPAVTALAATATPTQTAAPKGPVVIGRFPLLELPGEGREPGALTLLGDQVYVAGEASENIAVIADNRVQSFVPLGVDPSALTSDPAGETVYASSYMTPTLFKIQDNKIVEQVPAGGRVNALELGGEFLYVALDSKATIERYDAATLTKRDEVQLSRGMGISDLVIDEPRNRLYAAEYGRIVAVDLTTLQELNSLEAPYLYSRLTVNPQDGSIWSSAYDDKSSRPYVIGYSADGQELARLFLEGDLIAATFDDTGKLYVLDRFNNRVHVIQTPEARLVATLNVNESPEDAVFDAAHGEVWITNRGSDNVTVVNTADQSIAATIPLANHITALAANPMRKRIYAANASANAVYVIEGDRVVARAPTGNHPVDLAVDAEAGRLYVANRADGTLKIIDEDTLEITASEFVTNSLSTVAMDPVNGKLFAAGTQLNPETLKAEATFYAQGVPLGSENRPQLERADPAQRKLYALASNGVPGSNSRLTLYRFLYDDMAQSKLLGSRNGGNISAITIDPSTSFLFATNTHPLASTHGLDVFDEQETIIHSLAMASHTTALEVNPATHHLFLAHAQTFQPFGIGPQVRDNTVEILDTRTLGRVETLEVPNDPWRMALLGDTMYVASYRDGGMTLIRDAETAQPSAPTPTLTRTPYPTWTRTPTSQSTGTPVPQPTVAAALAECAFEIDAKVQRKAEEGGRARLGCPIAAAETSDQFAIQPLEAPLAVLFDDFRNEDVKVVTALFSDKTYREYPDTWVAGAEENQCPDAYVKPGIWRPKRGFGSVWCNYPEVQALGGGLVEERGASVTLQEFENGKIWAVADVGMFALFRDGTWE